VNQEFVLKAVWTKPEKGFTWEECDVLNSGFYGPGTLIPNPPYLVEKDYSQNFFTYDPFNDGALFAKFGDLDTFDKDALSGFASGYGRLVNAETFKGGSLLVLPSNSTLKDVTERHIHHLGVYRGDGHYAQPGESLEFWMNEHYDLSFAALVWELIVNHDIESLDKIVRWISDNKGVLITKFPRKALKAFDAERFSDLVYRRENLIMDEILFDGLTRRVWASSRFLYPDVIGPARLYVQTTINKKLLRYPLQIALTLNEEGELYKQLRPTSLLSAMWYQLYLALAGNISLRRCSICGVWEDMKGHRINWKKHKKCISYDRLEKNKLLPEASKKKKSG
jgi:hypothetical protein